MKQVGALLAAVAMSILPVTAEVDIEYRTSVSANISSGRLAPYMIGSWNYGRIDGASGIWHAGGLFKSIDYGRRLDWGAGVEYIVGYGSAANYDLYQAETASWTTQSNRQAPFRLQQLYGELKYRSVFLLAGMKERPSAGIVDDSMSSGDLTRSNNARPIPMISAGFNDFVDIPFTNGWVQIDGEIGYGKFFDKGYREETFNYYSGVFDYNSYYTYKRCHFRSNPDKPLIITFGMQTAGEFGGVGRIYTQGRVTAEENRPFKLGDIFEMFFPQEGSGEGYYKGNSLGSWDLKAQYRFIDGSTLAAYFEGPWEDGSGIGRKNGWDGLWGVQYNFAKRGPVNKMVVEYFDFTNQSGPIHWAPSDNLGTTIDFNCTGGDNYYNNDFYGPYSNYGLSIGSPFVVSPLYNENGSPSYNHNRARGVHAAVSGDLTPEWSYVVKASYQEAGGSGRNPAPEIIHNTSAMTQVSWTPGIIPGLQVKAMLAFDAGKLRRDNVGGMVSISYSGNFNIGKK